MAGLLHDVIDDTSEDILSVREHFGSDVARLVAGVSRLSHINQVSHDLDKVLYKLVLVSSKENSLLACY